MQQVLDYNPSSDRVPSTGAAHIDKEGTESEDLPDIPDWSQGAKARANDAWMSMIKSKTLIAIEGVSQQ
jgi:hypothetical protein